MWAPTTALPRGAASEGSARDRWGAPPCRCRVGGSPTRRRAAPCTLGPQVRRSGPRCVARCRSWPFRRAVPPPYLPVRTPPARPGPQPPARAARRASRVHFVRWIGPQRRPTRAGVVVPGAVAGLGRAPLNHHPLPPCEVIPSMPCGPKPFGPACVAVDAAQGAASCKPVPPRAATGRPGKRGFSAARRSGTVTRCDDSMEASDGRGRERNSGAGGSRGGAGGEHARAGAARHAGREAQAELRQAGRTRR